MPVIRRVVSLLRVFWVFLSLFFPYLFSSRQPLFLASYKHKSGHGCVQTIHAESASVPRIFITPDYTPNSMVILLTTIN